MLVAILPLTIALDVENVNLIDDELDQQMVRSNSDYAMYNGLWAAQSFKPTFDKLTRVELYLNYTNITKKIKIESLNDNSKEYSRLNNIVDRFLYSNSTLIERLTETKWIGEILKYFKNQYRKTVPNIFDEVGEITVSIRKELYGNDLTSTYVNKDFFPKDILRWVEFNFLDIEVEIDETYYIVLRAEGGDEKDFYNWRYVFDEWIGDYYKNGEAYFSDDAGVSWESADPIVDFTFKTYGNWTTMEPEEGDGIVERWAVICGDNRPDLYAPKNCAYGFYNKLIGKGWDESHIRLLINDDISPNSIYSSIKWMDEMDDGDDISLYFAAGHGSGICTDIDLIKEIDCLGAKGVCVVVDCCHSGTRLSLGKTGRVIITSTTNILERQYSGLDQLLFSYYFIGSLKSSNDVNDDGWVSAEESYNYLYPLVVEYAENKGDTQHPQIYDGYEGELLLVEV